MPQCDRKPDTSNICDVSYQQYTPQEMPGFCTILGTGGNTHRDEYCNLMSNAGEWGDAQIAYNGCSYNDCNYYQDIGAGCCSFGCCGIVGGGVKCKRLQFTGNPVTCCFQDYTCNQTNSSCFSDSAGQNTCDDGTQNGNYRSIVSGDCRNVINDYCTGNLSTDTQGNADWLTRWTDDTATGCQFALQRNIFQGTGSGNCDTTILPPISDICTQPVDEPLNSGGYFWGQQLINNVMIKYESLGFKLGSLPGSATYNPFQDYLYNNICCPYPGLCQQGLKNICSQYTAQRISLNPTLTQWCGCYLPDGEYQNYSVNYNIPPQCTPTCNRIDTIPIIGVNGDPVTCQQNICLIDNVSVNLINSQIGGGIDFNQICGNCQDAQCSCIISDTTVNVTNSTINGNLIPINQGCGSFTCTQPNPGITGPNIIPVQCGTTGYNPYQEYEEKLQAARSASRKTSLLWTILLIGLGLVVIFLIILFIIPAT